MIRKDYDETHAVFTQKSIKNMDSITLAALLGQSVVVKLQEHHLHFFRSHISLCKPIVIHNQRMGYVAMSYSIS